MEKRIYIMLLSAFVGISIGYFAKQRIEDFFNEITSTLEKNNLSKDQKPEDIEYFVIKIKKVLNLWQKLNKSEIYHKIFTSYKHLSITNNENKNETQTESKIKEKVTDKPINITEQDVTMIHNNIINKSNIIHTTNWDDPLKLFSNYIQSKKDKKATYSPSALKSTSNFSLSTRMLGNNDPEIVNTTPTYETYHFECSDIASITSDLSKPTKSDVIKLPHSSLNYSSNDGKNIATNNYKTSVPPKAYRSTFDTKINKPLSTLTKFPVDDEVINSGKKTTESNHETYSINVTEKLSGSKIHLIPSTVLKTYSTSKEIDFTVQDQNSYSTDLEDETLNTKNYLPSSTVFKTFFPSAAYDNISTQALTISLENINSTKLALDGGSLISENQDTSDGKNYVISSIISRTSKELNNNPTLTSKATRKDVIFFTKYPWDYERLYSEKIKNFMVQNTYSTDQDQYTYFTDQDQNAYSTDQDQNTFSTDQDQNTFSTNQDQNTVSTYQDQNTYSIELEQETSDIKNDVTPSSVSMKYSPSNEVDKNPTKTSQATMKDVIFVTEYPQDTGKLNSEIGEKSIAQKKYSTDQDQTIYSTGLEQETSDITNYVTPSSVSMKYSPSNEVDKNPINTSQATMKNVIFVTEYPQDTEKLNSEIGENSIAQKKYSTDQDQTTYFTDQDQYTYSSDQYQNAHSTDQNKNTYSTELNQEAFNTKNYEVFKATNTIDKIILMPSWKESDSVIHKVTNQIEHSPSTATTTSKMICKENQFDIIFYDLLISYNTTHLWGEVALTVNVSCPLDQIILHFEGVSVFFSSFHEKATPQDKDQSVALKNMNYDRQKRRIMIELMNKIKPKYSNVLSLKFISELSPFEKGASFKTYPPRSMGNETKERPWIIGTFLFPDFGRMIFPCIVSPDRRSIFHLRLFRTKGDVVVSNTPKKKTEMLNKDHLLDEFNETPVIPISSFTFNILPNYDSLIVERTPSLAFWFPLYLKNSVEQLVYIASDILDFFIEYFQYNLPIQQISVIVSEDLYSDPPSSFATILISSKYLFQKKERNYENYENIYQLLAKQFCDLWISNVVSFNSWNDSWIAEGFSIYMAHLATMHVYNDYDISSFIIRIQQNAYKYHRFPLFDENKLHKKDLYTNNKMQNTTPYKGAFLLHMIYNILKPKPFQGAIRYFFKEWALQSVIPDVFWDSFNIAQDNLDIKEFINSWAINYYPTLNADIKDNTVTVQHVSHPHSNQDYSSWWIPINYLTGKDINFDYTVTHWMKGQTIHIKFNFNDTWIFFNPHYAAFTRFNYSRDLWKIMQSGLRKGTTNLPGSVKAQLLDDAFTLASENLLDYGVPMTMALYLKNEEEYAPWFVALQHFSYLAEALINYPEWQIFQKYMDGIMSDISLKLQIETSDTAEKKIQGQLRKILMAWSCLNDLSIRCDKWVHQSFLKWKDKPSYLSENIILTDLKSIIYCMGAKTDDETSKYLYSLSKSQTITTEEALKLLSGVTCMGKSETFMEILNDMFDINNPAFSFLRLKEFSLSLKQSHLNSLLSFRYLKDHWKTIYERFHESEGILNAIIEGATYFLRTEQHYNEVLSLRDSVPESDYSTLSSLDLVIDQIVYNMNWNETNLNKLRKWFIFYNKTLI